MKIELYNFTETSVDETLLGQSIRSFEELLLKKTNFSKEDQGKSLQIIFLEEQQAQKINAQFRDKDYATDVLSFDPVESSSLGELVLCPKVIQRQAEEHQLSFMDEAVYLVFHGILHLLGYDHEKEQVESEKMFQIQDEGFEKFLHRDSNN